MTEVRKLPLTARPYLSNWAVWLLLLGVFAVVYVTALATPPLLDDADASHAQAAAHMAETGDLITSKVDGIRYLEKPPLPYWMVAGLYRVMGENAFATHLPGALAILGCAWLAWLWCRRAWGDRAALYAALGTLTACGPFLFTRFFIPEALLSFLLLLALYCVLSGLDGVDGGNAGWIYLGWATLALATLTKGLIAPVFFAGAVIPLLILSGLWRRWRELRPISGFLLFLLVAAPWHILAGIRNPDQGHPVGNVPTPGNVHGFWYFYFLNEHVFRFLGTRYPHDYNKLPFAAYWLLHLVWIFPWSLFFPVALIAAWKTRGRWWHDLRGSGSDLARPAGTGARQREFRSRSAWLLGMFAAFTMLFFSASTNQEYYTFPAWIPLIMLTAAMLAECEETDEEISPNRERQAGVRAWLVGAHGLYTIAGVISAALLGWGLWSSRDLPFISDIGTELAHRGVGDYSLSMSHFFDLTGPSFAALRLPAALAAITFMIGPGLGLLLRLKRRNVTATVSVGITSAVFLVAAHIAFARFEPMLSSKQIADTILHEGTAADDFVIFGDQSDGSSVVFYTHRFFGRPALLVHGNASTLLWGSNYPDAPKIFLSEEQLATQWGQGSRHWLFAQDINRDKVEKLLAGRLTAVQTIADKTLWTDRPLP